MESPITFTKKRGVKHLRIRITESGAVQVTVPFRVPMILAERFVKEKAAWITAKQQEVQKRKEGRVRADVPPFAVAKADALRFTTQKVEEMNRHYGFSYAKISVRNQKTRWGSCSKRKSLAFNYRIAFLPVHLAEYIVVHELCHLAAFDHSPRFWGLVAQVVPDYAARRKALRNYLL